jgi:hypothetical protein
MVDSEEYEKCKNDKYYFFKKYVLINGEEPLMTKEQFEGMIISWNNPHKTLKSQRPYNQYSSFDGSINDCGDANEY